MIKLYGYDTINTLKILMFLFETDVEFEFMPINIRTGDQHTPEFRAVNPAGKVPVIWNGHAHQTESNSILLTLSEQTGWGRPNDPALHEDLMAWLFYQASTQGPYFGQIEYWTNFAKAPNPDALAQYHAIAKRTIDHLSDQLGDAQYFCGDTYTIADIALFPWMRVYEHLGISLENAQNLARWLDRVHARPTTQRTLEFFNNIQK